MNGALLGAKRSSCAEPMDHAVVTATGLPSVSAQLKAAPPQSWTSIPRCRLYQACKAGASLALKKMPPMPVTRFISTSNAGGLEERVLSAAQPHVGRDSEARDRRRSPGSACLAQILQPRDNLLRRCLASDRQL